MFGRVEDRLRQQQTVRNNHGDVGMHITKRSLGVLRFEGLWRMHGDRECVSLFVHRRLAQFEPAPACGARGLRVDGDNVVTRADDFRSVPELRMPAHP